ncbi:hypothetical protein FHX74_000389 [Friedmanniella endophytica]|uniref:Lsr2 protein n=1 Tax=Microlunatus kandeliicorticis TaxID=1759536 RepID=A0A7W3P4G9_9ACTN|nr:Lsr2 family protein [Microlunatus kandeliicorticis]MBA8792795.1 hypothetical protein [Microlunatus kandeliicorticis]
MVQRGDAVTRYGYDETSEVRDVVDGSPAEVSVQVTLDGTIYLLPLSRANAARLRDDLGPWVAAARRVGAPVRRASAPTDRSQLAKIRSWAKQNGHSINARGRIPAAIQQAFAEAHA